MTDSESNPVECPATAQDGTLERTDSTETTSEPKAQTAPAGATADEPAAPGPAASMVTGYARRPRVGRAWPKVLGIAIGVPLLAIVVFIGLVASGVVQDRSKREYCRSWNQLASALGEEQAGLAAAVADGDRVALERITDQLIEDLEALSAPARATGLDAPVEAMLDHLRSQREALAESDEARLSELVNQVDQFVSQSQELLAASVRACG